MISQTRKTLLGLLSIYRLYFIAKKLKCIYFLVLYTYKLTSRLLQVYYNNMPNWCENTVSLTHSDTSKLLELENVLMKFPTEDDVMQGLERDTNAKFFEYYLPRPSNIPDNEMIDWNQKVWGTKWEPEMINFQRDTDKTITLSMDTAWSPPIGIYEYWVKNGWVVEALYHEPNCAFCGRFTNDLGDECFEYDESDLTTLKNIPEDVLDFTCIMDNLSDNEDASDEDCESENVSEKDYESEDEFEVLATLYDKKRRQASTLCYNKVILSYKDTKFINELESYLSLTIQSYDYEIFNLLFPRPDTEELQELNEDKEIHKIDIILNWNIEAWGTPCEPEIISYKRISESTIEFVFNTAYTPPINLYNFLVSDEWKVSAWYHISSAQACGRFTNEDNDVQYIYNNTDEKSIANIPQDVLQFSCLQ
jgi:hypothetical protein